MIRIREDTRTTNSTRKLGVSYIKNHKPNAPPPKPSSYSEFPSPYNASFSDGVRRVSMDENHGSPPYNTGGLLFLYRLLLPAYSVQSSSQITGRTLPPGTYGSVVVKTGDDYRMHYDGGFTKSVSSLPLSQRNLGCAETIMRDTDICASVNPDDLSALGNIAYNKLRPKVEKASLLQDIIEARDIPRMLKTTAKGFSETWKAVGGKAINNLPSGNARFNPSLWKAAPKGAAEQFLNAAFGWRPFVGSVVNVCDVMLFAADYIASAERNNDRWMHRRFAEDEIQSESLIYGSYGNTSSMCEPVLGINHIVPFSASFEIRRQSYSRVWYEGAFKVYRPEFDRGLKSEYPNIRKVRQMITLLGGNLNATTLYKVTPWTWLIDWFINVGGNIQAFEDLATGQVASKYMYIMRSTFDRFEYKVKFQTYDGQAFNLVWYKEASVKRRVPAGSPFGFSPLSGGLSAFQIAIMAALGISYSG